LSSFLNIASSILVMKRGRSSYIAAAEHPNDSF
jgi:hypothetical protein